ncbi:ATP-dependent RNA helicase drs1 [Striga asiatica]|uniref:ATP-dependent RNA helicase drs1 n=1 Tax=Striga asiatica TaxID=4170 RepID=A0A5A7PZ57_STRAF|nr:ATP-dependent RNA helicase drs1 [Striga asiatica]
MKSVKGDSLIPTLWDPISLVTASSISSANRQRFSSDPPYWSVRIRNSSGFSQHKTTFCCSLAVIQYSMWLRDIAIGSLPKFITINENSPRRLHITKTKNAKQTSIPSLEALRIQQGLSLKGLGIFNHLVHTLLLGLVIDVHLGPIIELHVVTLVHNKLGNLSATEEPQPFDLVRSLRANDEHFPESVLASEVHPLQEAAHLI